MKATGRKSASFEELFGRANAARLVIHDGALCVVYGRRRVKGSPSADPRGITFWENEFNKTIFDHDFTGHGRTDFAMNLHLARSLHATITRQLHQNSTIETARLLVVNELVSYAPAFDATGAYIDEPELDRFRIVPTFRLWSRDAPGGPTLDRLFLADKIDDSLVWFHLSGRGVLMPIDGLALEDRYLGMRQLAEFLDTVNGY